MFVLNFSVCRLSQSFSTSCHCRLNQKNPVRRMERTEDPHGKDCCLTYTILFTILALFYFPPTYYSLFFYWNLTCKWPGLEIKSTRLGLELIHIVMFRVPTQNNSSVRSIFLFTNFRCCFRLPEFGYFTQTILPSVRVIFSTRLAATQAQSMIDPSPRLIVG